MEMMDGSHGGPMTWRKRKLMDKGVMDDVCVCVRFCVARKELKCLKLKIPGILIQKIEEAAICSPGSKRPRPTTRSRAGSPPPHCHPPKAELYPCTHSRKLANCIHKVVSQRYVQFEVDPKLNGPFSIPIPFLPHGLTQFADFASIGSVLYALGGRADHFDPSAYGQILLELSGRHPTNPLQQLSRAFITDPPISGGKRLGLGPVVNSRPSCASDNVCYHALSCDFSKPDPQWEISSEALISPRLIPKLVSLQGMLFAFGGESPSDSSAPFAEVFDLNNNHWEPLPTPPFGRFSSNELFVYPLPTSGRILVVGLLSQIQYVFDISTWCWYPFEFEVEPSSSSKTDLYGALRIKMPFVKPVLSVSDEHLYWLNLAGRLCAYNVADDRYYEGFITGLHLECGGSLLGDVCNSLALLPLSQHLMGLLWFSHDQFNSSVFHLTILHVSFLSDFMDPAAAAAAAAAAGARRATDPDCQPNINLTAFAVACLSFPLEGYPGCKVFDAYLMQAF